MFKHTHNVGQIQNKDSVDVSILKFTSECIHFTARNILNISFVINIKLVKCLVFWAQTSTNSFIFNLVPYIYHTMVLSHI